MDPRIPEDHPVRHLIGGHVEMTSRPGVDYPIRTIYQPDEPPLEVEVADLRALGEVRGMPPAIVKG